MILVSYGIVAEPLSPISHPGNRFGIAGIVGQFFHPADGPVPMTDNFHQISQILSDNFPIGPFQTVTISVPPNRTESHTGPVPLFRPSINVPTGQPRNL